MTETARLGLPMLEPGQAQKELFHNEALLLLDAAVQPVVATFPLAAPPAGDRIVGTCYAVTAEPTGEWAGHPLSIAAWTAGGWRFVRTASGQSAWNRETGGMLRRGGNAWRINAAIAPPSGGATVDTEARATIAAMLSAMRTFGLIPV